MPGPSPPVSVAPPGRYRRWLRLVWRAGLAGSLLVLVIYLIEDVRGDRAWKWAQARLAAAGETGESETLRPLPVPAAENFCATPALDGVSRIGDEGDAGWKKRRRLERLETQPDSVASPRQVLRRETPNWAAWRRQLKSTRHLQPDPDEPDPAKAMILGFSPYEALFDELIEAARTRPRGAFERPFYHRVTRSNITGVMGFEPEDPLGTLCGALELRARLALAVGDTERAAALLTVLSRCRNAVAADPSAAGQAHARRIDQQLRRVLFDGLHRRAWTDDILRFWQEPLGALDYRQSMLSAARWELADAVGFLERMKADRSAGLREWYGDFWGGGEYVTPEQAWGFRLAPCGWLRQHQAAVSRHYLDHVITPLRDEGLLAWYHHEAARMKDCHASMLERAARIPSQYLFFWSFRPSTWPALQSLYLRSESRQLSVACALERHFLRHQRYPESLGALRPELLATLPVDLDGEPLRYAPDGANGRYRLWSVAVNLSDDWHGHPPPEPRRRSARDEEEALDWVLLFSG
jgi:hypothetical protein